MSGKPSLSLSKLVNLKRDILLIKCHFRSLANHEAIQIWGYQSKRIDQNYAKAMQQKPDMYR